MSYLQVFSPGEAKASTINFFHEFSISHSFSFKYIFIDSMFVLFLLHPAVNKGMWLALCPHFIILRKSHREAGGESREREKERRKKEKR